MICLWLEIILDVISNQSAITSRFTDRLGSFKPNCQLAPVGHDCARTTEAAVAVVPGYSHGCARTTNTQNHDIVRAISVHMLPDTWMSVKETTLYRDSTIWSMDTLIPVRHIYIEAQPNTPNFNRPQCVKRNIMRFVHPVDQNNVILWD